MKYQGTWVLIPPHIEFREDISAVDKILYGKIMALSKQEGYCYATNTYLAKGLGITGKNLSRHISRLVELGYLVREVVRNENSLIIKRKLYTMVMPEEIGVSPTAGIGIPKKGEDNILDNKQVTTNVVTERVKTPPKFGELTKEDIVGVASELRLTVPPVHRKHEDIMGLVRNGGFDKYKKAYDSTRDVLVKWLRKDIERGIVNHRNNIEDLTFDHEVEIYYQGNLFLG